MLATGISLIALALAPQDPGETARSILSDPRYQTEIPTESQSGTGRSDHRRSRRRGDGGPDGGRDRFREPNARSGDGLDLGILLWPLAGLAAIVLIARAVATARGQHRDLRVAAPQASFTEVTSTRSLSLPSRLRGDADSLAKESRFADAVRLLLAGAFDAMRREGAVRPTASDTSRPLLQRAELTDRDRSALRALVEAVEAALFAQRTVDRQDYDTCVQAFAVLEAQSNGDAT